MQISVILCTYNRCQSLERALKSIVVSKMPELVEWEVLVVDNNSKDQTREVTKNFIQTYPARLRYIHEPKQGRSNALNRGIREARGDVLAFMDDDVVVEPTWLRNLTRPLTDDKRIGTGGRIRPYEDVLLPPWISLEGRCSLAGVLALFDRGDDPIELIDDPPYGTNMAFRREAFEIHGMFRTDLGPCVGSEIRGEDSEFCRRLMRAGVPLLYVPAAIVHHDVPQDRLEKRYFLRWYFDYGRAFIRTRECRQDLWIVPRPLIGIANHILVMLPKRVFRWLMTFETKERFFAKTQIWMTAGETAEIYNRWTATGSYSQGTKQHVPDQGV